MADRLGKKEINPWSCATNPPRLNRLLYLSRVETGRYGVVPRVSRMTVGLKIKD
jgi:hypothetical protein